MKGIFKIDDMCRVFEVARSGYYSWSTRPLSEHDRQEINVIKPAIRQAFEKSRHTYGCARISAVLRRIGIPISEKRSRRIMREEKLVPKAARRFKRTTTIQITTIKSCPILYNRNFHHRHPMLSGRQILPLSGPRRDGCISLYFSMCARANGCRLGCQCYNGREYSYQGF